MSEKSAIRRAVRHLKVVHDKAAEVFDPARIEAGVGEPLACKKGCGHCCHQLVALSMVEALAIYDVIKDDPWKLQRVARWSAEQADLIMSQGVTEATWFRRGTRCMFLGDDSTCGIYETRPVACRTLTALGSSDHCRVDSQVSEVRRVQVGPFSDWALVRIGLLSEEAGLPLGPIPLPIAMQWAAIVATQGRDKLRSVLQGSPFYNLEQSVVYWAEKLQCVGTDWEPEKAGA